MDSVIVYNTPFDCSVNCSYCYLKKNVDLKRADIAGGLRLLNGRLSTDKQSTLIIEITHNHLSYEHVRFVLKKTKHLRRHRETHLQVNAAGVNIAKILDIMEDWKIDEIGVSCTPETAKQAYHVIATFKEYTAITVVLTIDDSEPQPLIDAATALSRMASEVFVSTVMDKDEIINMTRTKKYIEIFKQLAINLPNIIISPCIGKMRTKHCPISPANYMEITGNHVVKGCPYGLYRQCTPKE